MTLAFRLLNDAHIVHFFYALSGSIASEASMKVLEKYVGDQERVVKESCVVALDISEYEHSDSFQYADTMARLKTGENLITSS